MLLHLLDEDPPGHLRIVRSQNFGDDTSSIGMAEVLLRTLEQHGLAKQISAEQVGAGARRRAGWHAESQMDSGYRRYLAGALADECVLRLRAAGEASEPD